MSKSTKIHDAIVGLIVLSSAVLAWLFDPRWMWLAGLTALVMISSAFTGFCPIHYLVARAGRSPRLG